MALTTLLLVFTIFLRLTWLNKYNVADIITQYATEQHIDINSEQAIKLAKTIRKPMWQWHIYLGYLLTGIIGVRMLLPLLGEMRIRTPWASNLTSKQRLQFSAYLLFYVGIIISLITGLLIEFGPKEYKHNLEEVHELALYYLLPFMVIHLTGVLLAEFGPEKGIISKIVSGSKK